MKIALPSFAFSSELTAVERNRQLIDEWVAAYKSAIEALVALHTMNQRVCPHPGKRSVHAYRVDATTVQC